MITQDGWFDWMEHMPGPPDKVYADTNTLEGVLMHSAEGSVRGVINIVFSPIEPTNPEWTKRYPPTVTGVLGKDGRAIQFYSVLKSPWANGSYEANRRFNGWEHEGFAGEPLTDVQIDRDVRILKDIADFKGVGYSSWQRHVSLWEHNEMVRFGASPTACPSGRIPWGEIIMALQQPPQEEEAMAAIINKPGTPENYGFRRYPDPDPVFFKDATDRKLFSIVHGVQRGLGIPNDWAHKVTPAEWKRLTGKE